jgi:transposase
MRYPSDLTDEEWRIIEHHFDCGKYGNRRKHEKRELVNAVFYIVKTGCQWRMLPKDFPSYSTVHTFYRRCRLKGIWDDILIALVKSNRLRYNRTELPSYSIIDSQSVKTTGASEQRGIDGGKKNKRKKETHCCRYNGKSLACKSSCSKYS